MSTAHDTRAATLQAVIAAHERTQADHRRQLADLRRRLHAETARADAAEASVVDVRRMLRQQPCGHPYTTIDDYHSCVLQRECDCWIAHALRTTEPDDGGPGDRDQPGGDAT